MTTLTDGERAYLDSQPLGRLATRAPDGTLQNSPVGFAYDPQTGTIDIGGHRLAASRKFRNVVATGEVSFVVDDLASVDPWTPRMIEIRGRAEALPDAPPLQPGFGPGRIRIHPRRVLAFGVGEEGFQARTVG